MKDGVIHTGKVLSLTGTVPINYNCSTNAYTMILTGGDIELRINKGLTEDSSLRSMTLSGGANLFTGAITFLLTYPNSTGTKEL